MKLVNRGFLIIRPTNVFWNWVNATEKGIAFTVDDQPEPSVYLIEEDFFDVEPLIEQHFKAIFEEELAMITENESLWPANRTIDLFLEWFQYEAGTTVIDCEKSNLKADS